MIHKYFEFNKIQIKKYNYYLFYGENEGLKNEIINNHFKRLFDSNIYKYDETSILQNPNDLFDKIQNKSFFENEKLIILTGITNKFTATINEIVEKSKKFKFDKIAAVESRGFVFASAVSYILKKPFIMLRKKDKLPADTHSIDFELEYGTATIEVHKDSINKGEKVLIIDDLIATGGTAEAAAKLIEISKGEVASFIFVINLFDLGGSDNLINKGYKV